MIKPKAQLVPVDDGDPILLMKIVSVVGSSSDRCDVWLDQPQVLDVHCVIVSTENLLLVRDLGGAKSTTVNGEDVRERMLHFEDVLGVGGIKFHVRRVGDHHEDSPAAEHSSPPPRPIVSNEGPKVQAGHLPPRPTASPQQSARNVDRPSPPATDPPVAQTPPQAKMVHRTTDPPPLALGTKSSTAHDAPPNSSLDRAAFAEDAVAALVGGHGARIVAPTASAPFDIESFFETNPAAATVVDQPAAGESAARSSAATRPPTTADAVPKPTVGQIPPKPETAPSVAPHVARPHRVSPVVHAKSGNVFAASITRNPKALALAGGAILVVLIGFWAVSGLFSSGYDNRERAAASGTVLMGGQPLESGSIEFRSDDGRRATTAVISNGAYSFTKDTGPVVGENRVSIRGFLTTGKKGDLKQTYVPANFNDNSELKFEIKSGANDGVNFELSM